jgi:hypothetical protein
MITKTFLAAAIVLVAATASAQPPQDTPGPEHKHLATFVGTWKMAGTMNPGPMGPGGPFSGTETCRMFEGGFHLVCDSTGTGAMGTMTGHFVITWDRNAKVYRYMAINNMADAEMATGTHAGNTWTFKSEPIMGGQKFHSQFVITETSPTMHDFKWEMSEDGKKWTTVMTGKSTKTK